MFFQDRLLEVINRSRSGPFMTEQDFDLKLAKRLKELAKEINIQYNPQELCPSDDAMADKVFQAGLQLFVDVGVYHLDTQRVIKFSKQEVLEALRFVPREIEVGEGNEKLLVKNRGVEDPAPALNLSGPAGTPCSEDHYLELLISYAQEPFVDAIESGATLTYKGRDIIADTLLEVKAVQRDSATAREAVRLAGRPGMHIGDAATAMTAIGKISASDPVNGLRPSDGRLVSQMCELKTNDDQLARVPHLLQYGSPMIGLMTPLTGGIGGGPETMAILSVAEFLLGVVCHFVSYHYLSITHIKWTNNSDPWGLYILSMTGQAIARNTHILSCCDPFTVSGPCTDEYLYEMANHSIIATICGFHMHGVGGTGGNLVNHHTGLEAGFQGEISKAVTRANMTREKASEIALKLLPKYQETFNQPKRGKPFEQCYDLKRVIPNQKWQDCYRRVKEELSKLGLEFGSGPYDEPIK